LSVYLSLHSLLKLKSSLVRGRNTEKSDVDFKFVKLSNMASFKTEIRHKTIMAQDFDHSFSYQKQGRIKKDKKTVA